MAGYGGDSAFNAWLADNGYTLPSGLTAAVLRQRGSDYIDGVYGLRFTGQPTGGVAQERAWPRTGAEAFDLPIGAATIPSAVERASYAAAYQEAVKPGSLSIAVTASGAVKRKKVGPIEIEYADASGSAIASATPILSAVEGLLAPYLTCDFPMVMVV